MGDLCWHRFWFSLTTSDRWQTAAIETYICIPMIFMWPTYWIWTIIVQVAMNSGNSMVMVQVNIALILCPLWLIVVKVCMKERVPPVCFSHRWDSHSTRMMHLTSKNQISSSPYWGGEALESPLLIFQFQSFLNLFKLFATTKPSGPWRGSALLCVREDDVCWCVFERAGQYCVFTFISVTNHSDYSLSFSKLYINTL